jgi:DNA-binding CsgD family transcriptional regulator
LREGIVSPVGTSSIERARRQGAAIAELAHGSSHAHELRRRLFEPLREAVGFDSALVIDGGDGRVTACDKDPEIVARCHAGRGVYGLELAPMEAAASKHGNVCVDADVFTMRERARLRIYQEIYAPQHITSILRIYLRVSDHGSTIVSLARHGRSRRFGSSDAAAARAVAPMLLLAEALCAQRAAASKAPVPRLLGDASLSPRERQVAALVATGFRNREVAVRCGTSVHTVRKQLANVFAKLQVASRTELVARICVDGRPREGWR